jgi:hypothetical protein
MDLKYTPKKSHFAPKCAPSSKPSCPPISAAKVRLGRRMRKDDLMRWQKILIAAAGARDVAEALRRRRLECRQQHIFEEERAASARRRRFHSRCEWSRRC